MSQISTDLTNLPPQVLAYLANTPAIPPPPGVTPNFVNPHSRKNVQVITTSFILGLMVIFFCNRLYTKFLLMKKVTWDDGTIFIAVLSALAYYAACTWGAERGHYGTHQWNVSILQAAKMDLLVPSYMISVLTPLCFLFLKCSFFILYLQLFESARWLRFLSYFGLIATFLIYTVFTALVFTWATPKRGESWLAHQTTPAMARQLHFSVPQSIVGLVIDLYILFLPLLGVYNLTMTTKRKIGVMLIFLSGLLACICSACSIHYRIRLDATADVTWALIPVNISTLAEMFVGVIVACMPSAAYAARQSDSTYSRFLRNITSLKSTLFGSRYATQRSDSDGSARKSRQKTESHVEPDVLKSTDRKYARYFSLGGVSAGGSRVEQEHEGELKAPEMEMPTFPSATASRATSTEKVHVSDMV